MIKENNEVQLPEYLLVHPELKDDPVNKQNQIGFVTAAILNTVEFFVGFDDHEVGLYSADALLILKTSSEIYEFMHKNAHSISVDSFKDLKSIALLLDYGSKQHQRTALQVVQKNAELINAALITLEKSLGIDQAIRRGR